MFGQDGSIKWKVGAVECQGKLVAPHWTRIENGTYAGHTFTGRMDVYVSRTNDGGLKM